MDQPRGSVTQQGEPGGVSQTPGKSKKKKGRNKKRRTSGWSEHATGIAATIAIVAALASAFAWARANVDDVDRSQAVDMLSTKYFAQAPERPAHTRESFTTAKLQRHIDEKSYTEYWSKVASVDDIHVTSTDHENVFGVRWRVRYKNDKVSSFSSMFTLRCEGWTRVFTQLRDECPVDQVRLDDYELMQPTQ
jgi:hypothetical protein